MIKSFSTVLLYSYAKKCINHKFNKVELTRSSFGLILCIKQTTFCVEQYPVIIVKLQLLIQTAGLYWQITDLWIYLLIKSALIYFYDIDLNSLFI